MILNLLGENNNYLFGSNCVTPIKSLIFLVLVPLECSMPFMKPADYVNVY